MNEKEQLLDNIKKISSFQLTHPYEGQRARHYLFGDQLKNDPAPLYRTIGKIEKTLDDVKKYIDEKASAKRTNTIESHEYIYPNTKGELLLQEKHDVTELRTLHKQSLELLNICKKPQSTEPVPYSPRIKLASIGDDASKVNSLPTNEEPGQKITPN